MSNLEVRMPYSNAGKLDKLYYVDFTKLPMYVGFTYDAYVVVDGKIHYDQHGHDTRDGTFSLIIYS